MKKIKKKEGVLEVARAKKAEIEDLETDTDNEIENEIEELEEEFDMRSEDYDYDMVIEKAEKMSTSFTPQKLKTKEKDFLKKLLKNRPQGDKLKTKFKLSSCIPLDLGLTNGKGIPRGASIMFYAAPGTGKTTIFADMLYRILAKQASSPTKERAVYIDTEGSRELLIAMGLSRFIDDGTLILIDDTISIEEAELIYEAILQKEEGFEDVKYIFVDSLTNLTSKKLLDSSVSDGDFGSNAKERGRFYPKFLNRCKQHGITQFYVSQLRANQDAAMYGPKTRPAVTDMDMHFMDIIAQLTKDAGTTGINESEVKTSTGTQKVKDRFRIVLSTSGAKCKNRYCKVPKISILIEPGVRVVNAFNLDAVLQMVKYVKKSADKKYTIKDDLLEFINKVDLKETQLSPKEYFTVLRSKASAIEEFLFRKDLFYHAPKIVKESDDGM